MCRTPWKRVGDRLHGSLADPRYGVDGWRVRWVDIGNDGMGAWIPSGSTWEGMKATKKRVRDVWENGGVTRGVMVWDAVGDG